MRKRTRYLLLIIVLLSISSMVTYGYSYAKYVSNHAWNYYLGTKGFYFGSDELGIEKITNVNNNWDFESTYFRVKNSENDYLVTDYDIQYTVKCTIKNDASENSKCLLNGTDMDTFSGVISSSSVANDTIYSGSMNTPCFCNCFVVKFPTEFPSNKSTIVFSVPWSSNR